MRRFLWAMATVGVLGAATASAQERGRADALFERADTNGDGVIAREEFNAARTQQFNARDLNGDGFIDASDLKNRAQKRPRAQRALDAIIAQFDANSDQKVSASEFIDAALARFDRLDADSNGMLDRGELAKAKRQ